MLPTAIRRATVAGAAGTVKNMGKQAQQAKGNADQSVLNKGAKRDPELYVRGTLRAPSKIKHGAQDAN